MVAGLRVVELHEHLARAYERALAHRDPYDAPANLRAQVALVAFEASAHGHLRQRSGRPERPHHEKGRDRGQQHDE